MLSNTPLEKLMKLAVFAVVDLAARGFSNQSIAEEIGIPLSDVENDLYEFTDGVFTGFDTDLDRNPIVDYNSGIPEKDLFFAMFMTKYFELRKELDL